MNQSDDDSDTEGHWDPRDYTREELYERIRANLEHSLAIRGTDADPLVQVQKALDRLASRRF